MGHLNQGSEELVSLILGKAKLPSFHSVTFSHSIMGALCYCQWNDFSIFPPAPHTCVCSSSIAAVHASLGIWLIGKLVPAEEVEDCASVFYLNKYTLQFNLLDFVLWMRTPQEILSQPRNCLLIPDHRLQSVLLLPLKAHKSLINEAISRFINN